MPSWKKVIVSGSAASLSSLQVTSVLEVSGTVAFPNLTTTNQLNVVTINTASGQLYYTASSAIGGTSGPTIKAGSGSVASFGGSPLTASVTFTTPFTNNNYSISIIGEDARTFTIQSKVSGSFAINTNSTDALTGPVYWTATAFTNS